MKMQVSASQSKALALALAIIFLGAVYGLLVAPMHSLYRANQERIEALMQRLGHYQRLAGERPALEAELKAWNHSQPGNALYLKSNTAALATAELQAHAKRIIEQAGGSFVSSQPLETEDGLPSRWVRVRVRMAGDMEAVQKVLYELGSGKPALLLDDLMLQAYRLRRTPTGRQELQIDGGFNLAGLMGGADK